MLKDTTKIKIESGSGGNGSLAMNTDFADGGDGGNGGNVYIEGDENIYDLSDFDYGRTYRAGRGENGSSRRHTGSNGRDLILKVPLTTEVHKGARVPYIITTHGQKAFILRGGMCGFGSITIRKHKEEALTSTPQPGKLKEITLILKLKSDIIFLGYPNAGKSSLLNSLTKAHVKIAPYEFTTLEPQLGYMDNLILMDLPGLIEGTSEGKGLGTSFVKHTEYAKLVAHCISLENNDPLSTYQSLRKEINKINSNMSNKPEIVILAKSDIRKPEEIELIKRQFLEKYPSLKVFTASIIDDNSMAILKENLIQVFRDLK